MDTECRIALLEEKDTAEIINYIKQRVLQIEKKNTDEFVMFTSGYLNLLEDYNPRNIRLRKINYKEEWVSLINNDEPVGIVSFSVDNESPVLKLNLIHVKEKDLKVFLNSFNKIINILKKNVVSKISKLRASIEAENNTVEIWQDIFLKLGFQIEARRRYGTEFKQSCIDYIYHI